MNGVDEVDRVRAADTHLFFFFISSVVFFDLVALSERV